ncbi:putative xylanase [Ilyonectria sp. MPI-CAGE-AT-0026]|nr:putative xylanase [Ilyonectria sp. MPI-CAGE-AT-0026]
MALLRILKAGLVLGSLFGSASAFTNPIRSPGGSDPQVTYSGGWYYLISTEWDNLQLARAETIEGLKTAESKIIYSDTNASRCCNVWAPELHFFDGNWYLYYTAGNSGATNLDNQRSHVIKGGASPWDDDWAYAGQMAPDWGIDGSILRFNGWGNYFVYSCMTGVPNQSTCIRKLGDDYISTGDLSIISQPDQPWEQSGVPVHEGQVGLYFGNKTYIAYSANYCWTPEYCIALLEWDGTTDPALSGAWTKSDGCHLSSGNGNFGTGHNSFFTSPDGSETWITFHATSNSAGACDDSRYAMVQPLTANEDGSPNFGIAEGFSFEWPEPSGGNA